MSKEKAISKMLKRILSLSLVLSIMYVPCNTYAINDTNVKAASTEDSTRIAAAYNINYLQDENCLTNTEWRSGGWGDPNAIVNIPIDYNYNYYRFSIVKRSGKWTNGGYFRMVRISDNKIMFEYKNDKSSDWDYHNIPTKLLKEGDYRLVYGYGKQYENKNWMMYYSKIIRLTKASN